MRDLHHTKHRRILKEKTNYILRPLFALLDFFELVFKRFITFHIRPMRSSDIRLASECQPERLNSYGDFAVIIQGAILHDLDFTLETVNLYARSFKGAKIIISTWDWEEKDKQAIKKLEEKGGNVKIILNEKIDSISEKGEINNFNLQVISSRAGVALAKKSGAKYILKTRADQRIYNADVLDFFLNLLKCFPMDNPEFKQRARIIAVNRGKSRPRLYHFVDWLIFGTAEDMETFWSDDLLTSEMNVSCESYLFSKFLEKVGHKPLWTKEDSLSSFVRHCILVDLPMIDLYWRKYDYHREYRFLNYFVRDSRNFGFVEWLNMYYKLYPVSDKLS